MNILNATEARAKLYSLIDEAASTHQPIVITGKRGNAVLISEEDWNAISETLYLMSVPGMRESIKHMQNIIEFETLPDLYSPREYDVLVAVGYRLGNRKRELICEQVTDAG